MTYLDDFDLVDYHWTDAPGTDGVVRQVVVFRLKPSRGASTVETARVPVTVGSTAVVETAPIEEQHSERAVVTPGREPYAFERREATLVNQYATHLRSQGHTVSRLRIVPPGESAPLYSDLWDETDKELVEAKGLVTREQLRMAVGQLFDYRRFIPHSSLAVLVPERPRDDLLRYLNENHIVAVYPTGHTWSRNSGTDPAPGQGS